MAELCAVPDCSTPRKAKGFCGMHYARWVRLGQTGLPPRVIKRCSVEGCEQKRVAKGLCSVHYPKQKILAHRATVERFCMDCEQSIPLERNLRSKFCSHRCKLRFNNRKASRYKPEMVRWQQIKTKYGLRQADYEQMLIWQGGRCAICFTDSPGGRGGWHIDHCHDASKRVRGILCSNCNGGLGNFRDNPEFLREAAAYLEK